jgi:predicted RNA binding protein YcfA (HicA-like mRNA interferase family)
MRVAESRGWVWKRNSGDHYIYVNPEYTVNLSIPDHRELREGTVRDAIKKMGMTVDEFLAALKD